MMALRYGAELPTCAYADTVALVRALAETRLMRPTQAAHLEADYRFLCSPRKPPAHRDRPGRVGLAHGAPKS